MGVFKVLGGAVAGIAAVAAAPVLAPVGAITAVGVAVGSVGGAVAGTVIEKGIESIHEKGDSEGYNRAKAEDAVKLKQMENMIQQAKSALDDKKAFERYVVSLYAVALSAAHCNNKFEEEQKEYIEDFVLGKTGQGFPESLKGAIEKLYNNPPSFKQAMVYVEKVDRSLWSIYDEIIAEIIEVDGVLDADEIAFENAWYEFKAS